MAKAGCTPAVGISVSTVGYAGSCHFFRSFITSSICCRNCSFWVFNLAISAPMSVASPPGPALRIPRASSAGIPDCWRNQFGLLLLGLRLQPRRGSLASRHDQNVGVLDHREIGHFADCPHGGIHRGIGEAHGQLGVCLLVHAGGQRDIRAAAGRDLVEDFRHRGVLERQVDDGPARERTGLEKLFRDSGMGIGRIRVGVCRQPRRIRGDRKGPGRCERSRGKQGTWHRPVRK